VRYIILIIIETTFGIVVALVVTIITITMDVVIMKDYQQQLIPHKQQHRQQDHIQLHVLTIMATIINIGIVMDLNLVVNIITTTMDVVRME
jgi:hypothetical protein